MDHLRVIDTGDGSHSLLHTTLQETYHSVHGAVQEAQYVFVEQGLRVADPGKQIRILEIGFGTGLNALMTLLESNRRRLRVVYESWEKYPLPENLWKQLNYGEVLKSQRAFEAVNEAAWENKASLTSDFQLLKKRMDLLKSPIDGAFDLIYYDAFAPSRQPEMWTLDVLKKVTDALAPGGSWVTYCAKGQVKRDLVSLGLTVEALPGPPGKKEMTRAKKPV